MDQKTILTGLMHALENGQGGLDELDKLLDRAKADIATAKAEEAKRKDEDMKKRAESIADMATRVLHDDVTAADVAMVMNSYLKSQGIDANVTVEAVEHGVTTSKELDEAISELGKSLEDLFDNFKKPARKPGHSDPDQIINQFLKDLDLR